MENPTAPLDLLRHGEQYLEASDAVHQTLTHQPRYQGIPPLPTLQLIGGAFEMLFKAFLLDRGESLRLLQSMDSDLERARRRSVEIGIGRLVVFQGLEETAIDLLGRHLVNRHLAFDQLTDISPPPYFLLRAAAGRLAAAVRQDLLYGHAEGGGHPGLLASSA